MEARGENHHWRYAGDEEYRALLAAKLIEEAAEARDEVLRLLIAGGGGDVSRMLSELADVTELVLALAAAFGATPGDVRNHAVVKRADRGGYEGRLIWDGPADDAAATAVTAYEEGKIG